jgi:L-ascorbate metabolism protein UlaG (beta-lactamase superfamily)
MLFQRLPWAGVLLRTERTSVVIDPLFYVNTAFFGSPLIPFYPLDEFGEVDAVLVTHLHTDHFDPKAIAEFYGADIPLYVPAESWEKAVSRGLTNVTGMAAGQQVALGDLTITAVFSSDGLGDPQVGWVVEGEDKRVIHCGDTLWHGQWWNIARMHGPFDVACLPINGAIIETPELTPSDEPLCLTPEQAVSAAVVLGAKRLVPIHFGAFDNPPVYRQTYNPVERVAAAAAQRGVQVVVLQPKERLEI